jgi:ubiquinone/menaquinone biosynthesis C-methylase UbiE
LTLNCFLNLEIAINILFKPFEAKYNLGPKANSWDNLIKARVPKTDYSKIAEYYDRVRQDPVRILLSKLIEHGKIDANCVVLDVGCGTGRFCLGISALKNCMVCGLEPSIEMLKRAVAKDHSRSILWVRGDGQNLPFRDNSFHCTYMTLVIHHVEDKDMALREIYRTLMKDGTCVIMTNSHYRMKKHALSRHFPGVTAIDLRRFPSVPSLKKAMTRIGFRDAHYHIVKYDEGPVPTDEYLERVRNKYISTLTLLSEEAFQRGFKIFQKRIREIYGRQIKRIVGFDFVVGVK